MPKLGMKTCVVLDLIKSGKERKVPVIEGCKCLF